LASFDINRMAVVSKLGRQCKCGSYPRTLILLKRINAGLERCCGALFREGVASLGFRKCSAGYIYGVSSGVGSSLRDSSLPYSDACPTKSPNDQQPGKPDQIFVGFDLRTCELVLLILASATGCLFWVLWGVKNDSISLTMGMGCVSLFLIGQLAVYLLCRRIYGI
jgi:hypothetical protein